MLDKPPRPAICSLTQTSREEMTGGCSSERPVAGPPATRGDSDYKRNLSLPDAETDPRPHSQECRVFQLDVFIAGMPLRISAGNLFGELGDRPSQFHVVDRTERLHQAQGVGLR